MSEIDCQGLSFFENYTMSFDEKLYCECYIYNGMHSIISFCTLKIFIEYFRLCIPISFLPLTIIIISLFGKIKEDYRFFFLNMAIFEFIYLAYFSICPDCSYDQLEYIQIFGSDKSNILNYFANFISEYFRLSPFIIFLLAASRFLAVFFPLWYKFKVTTKKVIFAIVLSNIISFSGKFIGVCFLSKLKIFRTNPKLA